MRRLFLLISLGLGPIVAWAQLNVQAYTPSVLLTPGQWEVKHYNNLYTQTFAFDAEGSRAALGQRGTWFASINSGMTGLNDRWNVGAEFWLRSVRLDQPSSSALNLFRFENNSMARTAPAYVGPKVKFLPFENQRRLSVQSTFLIPLAPNLEGDGRNQPWLDGDRYLWITQLLFDYNLSSQWQVFIDFGVWVTLDRVGDKSGHKVETPTKVFLSYFPNSRWTIFAMNEFWPTYGTEEVLSSYFWQAGLGAKYQIMPGLLEGEVMSTQFLAGKLQGAGTTFNAGIRVIW